MLNVPLPAAVIPYIRALPRSIDGENADAATGIPLPAVTEAPPRYTVAVPLLYASQVFLPVVFVAGS